MEFPVSLEEHLHQLVKQIIGETTAKLQELFHHQWKAIPGNFFWDVETGSDFWWSCYTQLNPASKQRIVKGQINKWSIADLAVLLPEVIQRNGNSSSTKLYSEVLQSIHDLIAPFETKNMFVSFEALSVEGYEDFISSLKSLLTQLDTDTMMLSGITRDVISLEDLTQVVAKVFEISQEASQVKVFSLVSELWQKFPILPPHLEAAMYILRCNAPLENEASSHTKAIQIMKKSLKMLSYDRLNIPAHYNLVAFYRCIEKQDSPNSSILLYHIRKTLNLQFYRAPLFNFVKSFLDQRPMNEPSCDELYKGLLLMQKDGLIPLNELCLAMGHFKRASQHGIKHGVYAFRLGTILVRDYKQLCNLKSWTKTDHVNYQYAVQMLINEVKMEHMFYKYNSSQPRFEIRGQAHFLLGYQYEKGYLLFRDFDKAKTLYQTAVAVHNNEMASYFLGSMYYDGAGVRKSYVWAKLYWQHSIAFNQREWPTFAMIDYYLKHLEIIKAKILAMALVNMPGRHHIQHVTCIVENIKRFNSFNLQPFFAALNGSIVDFEQTWKLSGKGLTLLERLKRAELLGVKHEFGVAIKQIYDLFKLSYGTERNNEGDGGTMSEYIYGLDESLEVDYSLLFSRIYLLAPARIFTVTTFRHNLATTQQPKWKIKYNTRSRIELYIKLANTFTKTGKNDERFIVVEDPLFEKDGIYLLIEDTLNGDVHQLKLTRTKAVMRVKKHLKLEYGAKIIVSYDGNRGHTGNADYFFNDTKGPVQVIVIGMMANMCRFCADPILKITECVCGFRYCGQTCLEKDRKYLEHEFLCTATR